MICFSVLCGGENKAQLKLNLFQDAEELTTAHAYLSVVGGKGGLPLSFPCYANLVAINITVTITVKEISVFLSVALRSMHQRACRHVCLNLSSLYWKSSYTNILHKDKSS